MRHACIALALLALALLAGRAPAADLAALTDRLLEAQSEFDRGVALRRDDPAAARQAFEDAAEGFAEVLREAGDNGLLWFNLGNARLLAGQLGPAILAYRNAALLAPADHRVQANLAYARSLRQDQIAPRGAESLWRPVLEARNLLSPGMRLTLALLFNAIFWTLMALRWWRPAAAPWPAVAAAAALTLLLGASLAADEWVRSHVRDGVLLANEVVLRKGNGEGFEPAINERLGQGVECRVLDVRPGWVQVRLPDGTEGWVKQSQIGIVGQDAPGRAATAAVAAQA